MKQNHKKYLALGMAAAMLAATLSACGGSDSGETSSASATDTSGGSTRPITIVAPLNNNVALQNTDAFIWSTQNGKYQFDVECYDRAVMAEKVNLMLSTNNYPDVFVKAAPVVFTSTMIDDYGKKGIFIPLNDLIKEHAPNLSKLLEERPTKLKNITSSDGNIYSLPGISEADTTGASTVSATWINQSWLTNLGLDMPTDMQSFYEVLTAFKEQDANGNGDPNDEIPVMMSIGPTQLVTAWLNMVGQKWDSNSNCIEVDGKLQDVRACDAYKEVLSWVAKFYQEELLDQNIFTQEISQAQAIGKSADVTGVTGGSSPLTYCGNVYGMNFTYIPPFGDDIGYLNSTGSVGTLMITDHCEDPAAVMEWIDQFYSEEGGYRAWMGEEGVNYKFTNEEKTMYEWIVPEGSDVTTMRSQACLQGIGYTPALSPAVYNSGNPDPLSRLSYEATEAMRKASSGYFPVLSYESEDQKTVAAIEADISAYADTYAAKVATGELDLEESWPDYIKQLEAMRMGQMLEIKQTAYDLAISTQ